VIRDIVKTSSMHIVTMNSIVGGSPLALALAFAANSGGN
jgi:hypothetical protein